MTVATVENNWNKWAKLLILSKGTPMEVSVKCVRGNCRLTLLKSVVGIRVGILTGQRRKWDHLHWSLMNDDEIAVQGLWRGRYADAIVKDTDLFTALETLGADETIKAIRRARGHHEIGTTV